MVCWFVVKWSIDGPELFQVCVLHVIDRLIEQAREIRAEEHTGWRVYPRHGYDPTAVCCLASNGDVALAS